ncbi:hypothetical protein O159_18230 [Leifsonia xyli subsp. cynodontis DSM 46306]|jgi:hypothetical protein|uniref:Uncharacterized protein n=1 Tax=Leifsonia xyli subsp. cynodontis DSM 46306 TaxID=1389489 RepID=U3P7P7_LEIXC|nr:hypothetical protein [Leifsonia xyli]AGW41851.1 hypothetical protein O159_18230 [Leifsonia xyli subsp. cynodontis DSM 46306]
MILVDLSVSGEPVRVCGVSASISDMWAWTLWCYATDDGMFNGCWDDQLGQFRMLYDSDSLLGCFLEMLAKLRLSSGEAGRLR